MKKNLDEDINIKYNTPVMKYTVKFINESAKNLKLKATIGTPKQKAYADSLRQMVIDRFKDKVDEELIYHVLNSDTWHKASFVIDNRQMFYNNDGSYDEIWMKEFEMAKPSLSTTNIGKSNNDVELFIPAWAIHKVDDKNWGDGCCVYFESPIHKVKSAYHPNTLYCVIRIQCPKSFIVSKDNDGIRMVFKKRDGRKLAFFNLEITSFLSDLANGVKNAGTRSGSAYYATDRKDRGGWGKLVEIISEINAGFKK